MQAKVVNEINPLTVFIRDGKNTCARGYSRIKFMMDS